MKKLLFVFAILVLMISLSGVSYATETNEPSATAVETTQPDESTTAPEQPTTDSQQPTTDPEQPTTEPEISEETIEDVVSLDGKTIMIVGNSMVYYGNCVILGDQGKEDFGYFYQLIASNGEKATVIDYTYPGKKLDYIYENYLLKIDPKEFEKVDYLVLSEGNQYNEDLVGTCERIIALCPNIKGFRFLRQPNMFDVDDKDLYLPILIEQVEKLKQAGYEVVDWGKLVRDIFTGETKVPGATLEFKRTTFMKENKGYKNAVGTAVSQGIRGDRNHQNPLSGYITAQMLYTSLTNRSAVFSNYSFCGDKSIHIYFDLPEYDRVHYTGEEKSNFREVFASAQDMLGLQKLIDIYVAKEGRHPLTVQKGLKATCTSNGLSYGSFCSLCGKVVKTQEVIESLGEHELVFTKGKAETCTENGLTDSISCSRCGEVIKMQEVIPARVHSGLTTIKAATTSADGVVKSNCRYCGLELSSTTVKAVKRISISQSSYIYDGLEHKPSVTVVDVSGKTLLEGTDYTVGYEAGRIQAGKYTVKVTLKGNYSGVHRRYFTVSPKAVIAVSAVSTADKITLSWPSAEGAAFYRIYELNEKTGEYKYYDSVTGATEFTASELPSGTKYTFSIRSGIKDDGTILSGYSPEREIATVPSAVSGISATQTTASIKLTWNAVKGATGYRAYMFNSSKKAYEQLKGVITSTELEIKSLTPATVCKFKVVPFISTKSGEIVGSESAEFTTSTKPGVTSEITATQTASSVKLSWNAVKGANAYRVYKYSTKTKSFESVAYVTDGTSCEIKKLKSGTTYKFKVRAYTDIDCGKFAGAMSAELRTATKPGVTSKIAATQTTTSIRLIWSKVKGATAYRIYRYDAKKKAYVNAAYVTDATSYEFKKLRSGTSYKFKVRAYTDNSIGKLVGSMSAEFATSTKPETPTVKASSSSKGKVSLTWTNVTGESGYQVYYALKGTDSFEKYASVKTDTAKLTVSKLKSKKTYLFRVRAYKKTANGTVYGDYKTVEVRVK